MQETPRTDHPRKERRGNSTQEKGDEGRGRESEGGKCQRLKWTGRGRNRMGYAKEEPTWRNPNSQGVPRTSEPGYPNKSGMKRGDPRSLREDLRKNKKLKIHSPIRGCL